MNRRLLLFVILCLTVLAAACQRAPQKTSEIPRVLSHQYSVAVMPFTQPTDACELIMGRIPEGQGCISAGEMGLLDADLKELLLSKKNARPYTVFLRHRPSGAARDHSPRPCLPGPSWPAERARTLSSCPRSSTGMSARDLRPESRGLLPCTLNSSLSAVSPALCRTTWCTTRNRWGWSIIC